MGSALIIGTSGSGKSTGARNLDPVETIIIKVIEKDLPFKHGRKNYNVSKKNSITSDDPELIIKAIEKINTNKKIKTLIIDDAQYIMANQFMRRAKEKGYEKFTDIGESFWRVMKVCISCREDLDVFVLSHSEESEFGKVKLKTIGKMVDEKIDIAGMFTTVLKTEYIDGKYLFRTKTEGNDCIKSPMGLFDEEYIENDLLLVKKALGSYYDDEDENDPSIKKDKK